VAQPLLSFTNGASNACGYPHTQIRQAMRVLIHTHISCRLLVEGSAPKPLLNTEFHSVAARSANALKGYAKAPFPFRCPGTNRSTLIA